MAVDDDSDVTGKEEEDADDEEDDEEVAVDVCVDVGSCDDGGGKIT